jgi:transposase
MRARTLLRRLGVTGARFFRRGAVSVEAAPSWHWPRYGVRGRRAPIYDRWPLSWWRHLVVVARVDLLAYAPRRVHCRRCSVGTGQVPPRASGVNEWVRRGAP